MLVVKFIQIKKNYFSVHRPHQFKKKISYKNFKIQIRNFLSKKDIKDLKYILIGGAGLIDEKKIILNKIINCHSGLIPESRFKFSKMVDFQTKFSRKYFTFY